MNGTIAGFTADIRDLLNRDELAEKEGISVRQFIKRRLGTMGTNLRVMKFHTLPSAPT
jgi:hypothetical protein